MTRAPYIHIRRIVYSLFVFAVVLWSPSATAAPKAELWARWAAHDPTSTLTVDHAPWDAFLKAYVRASPDGINRVAYGAVSVKDTATLKAYIASLEATPVSKLDRASQRAFWINLYNAGTVDVVLDHWPVRSIRDIDISPGWFADGPWGKKLFRVEGEGLALNDIEHRILRPIWRDPRIHYAVNCASLGCPNLMPEAFTPENTERLLDADARAYINHPRGATVADDRLTVSSIYEWFKADFGGTDQGVIDHLRRYADADLTAALKPIKRISDDRYDWSVNAAPN